MTSLVPVLAAVVPALPLVRDAARAARRAHHGKADALAVATALPTAAAGLLLAGIALARGGERALRGQWYLIDGASGVLLAVIAIVGLCSALLSPTYLRTSGRSWTTAARSRSLYYAALFMFWGALLAVPIAGNLAAVWLIVEATTAASALLVAFSGRRDALEAGWKYLLLTTLGLSVAFLGIIVLAIGQANAGHHNVRALDWYALQAAAHSMPDTGQPDRVCSPACWSCDQDRLGAGPQLAAGRPQRGAGTDQRAALGGAAAERAAGRMARQRDTPALRRRRHHTTPCSSRSA